MPDMINWNADEALSEDIIQKLADILESGDTIVYPTNTLYGIGASIFSEVGIRKVHSVKGRPEGMPLSIMATEGQIKKLCQLTDNAQRFIDSGDLRITAILPAQETAPQKIVHDGTLAIRLPTSKMIHSLIAMTGPITATSANIHGKEAPATCESAMSQLGENAAIYINSGEVGGFPSTLIDFTGEKPKVIREGALSPDDMRKIYG